MPSGQTTSTPWYVSSTGSGLSATLGGVSVMGIAQAISVVGTLIGHPVTSDAVTGAITTVVTAVGAVYAVFGLCRKVYIALTTKTSA